MVKLDLESVVNVDLSLLCLGNDKQTTHWPDFSNDSDVLSNDAESYCNWLLFSDVSDDSNNSDDLEIKY